MIQRATIAHQLTNCLTEPLFEQALARATFLDQHLATTGQPLGPLHGLPISVKDTFHLAGIDSSIGIAALCFRPALENSPIVQLLLDAGAVIHCKTNVPQTLLALDSTNNIFGRTLNPENRQQWTAGGSSGGEAVLVKMRGSVMGVGTDVGGSIRIPAMCNGIYGFKPSVGRVPAGGQETGQLPAAGKVGMESSVGPIARCLDDIALFMEVVEAARMWERDSSIVPGRWWDTRNDISKSPLKKPLIGIIWTDGNVNPLPPIRKVLQEMKQSLQAAGISIIDIPAPVFSHCQPLANKFFTAEGSAHIFSLLSSTSEALIPWLSTRLKPNRPTSLSTFRDLQAQRSALHDEFLKIFKTPDGQTIDALICPVAPHPVPPLDRWNSVGYTSAFVLLDYPAASIPVRRVRACDLEGEMGAEVLRGWDRVNRALCELRALRSVCKALGSLANGSGYRGSEDR